MATAARSDAITLSTHIQSEVSPTGTNQVSEHGFSAIPYATPCPPKQANLRLWKNSEPVGTCLVPRSIAKTRPEHALFRHPSLRIDVVDPANPTWNATERGVGERMPVVSHEVV